MKKTIDEAWTKALQDEEEKKSILEFSEPKGLQTWTAPHSMTEPVELSQDPECHSKSTAPH